MGLPVRFHTSASPEAVIAAIREDGRRKRGSIMPPSLRKQGVRGMQARISGDRFTLKVKVGQYSEYAPAARLRARVLPGEDGGSVIAGECTAGDEAGYFAFFGLGLALLFTSLRDLGGVILFFTVAVGVGFLIEERRIERGDDEVARYLTSRLEATLASLGEVSAESAGPA